MPIILAIESSCDDTSAAVIADGEVLSNVTAGQAVHEEFGGVVPEHASRAHQRNIVPLMVGVSFAKAFALARNLPLIEVDHMQAHVLAHFAEAPKPTFPFLCLTVSGGHTQLVVVRTALDQEIIGRTIDDAAGEAFDKSGKMLGLSYPAGPSFSGLKTSILYTLQKKIKTEPDFVKENLEDICASIQHTIVSILLRKLTLAVEQTGLTQVALAGGVSANSGLREGVQALAKEKGWTVFIPRIEYCTDNAAMIGVTGTFKYAAGEFVGQEVAPAARF